MEVDNEEDNWDAWDQAVHDIQAQNDDQQQMEVYGPLAHPEHPQDSISFIQSGSTASYLRRHGPDIFLTVHQVLEGQLGDISSSSSDSSSSVTSIIVGTDLVTVTSFDVALDMPILGLQIAMPPFSLLQLDSLPDGEKLFDNSKTLVTSVPILPAIILRDWAFYLDQQYTFGHDPTPPVHSRIIGDLCLPD